MESAPLYLAALLNELAELMERGETVFDAKRLLVVAESRRHFDGQLIDVAQLLLQSGNLIFRVLISTK